MKDIYSRIQIPKHLQVGDISEIFIVKHCVIDDFNQNHKIDVDFGPITQIKPKNNDFFKLQEEYVKRANEYQSNLILIDDSRIVLMRCQEQKQAGLNYPGVGVGSVVTNLDDEYLLVKRSGLCNNRVGQWENAGGTQEIGESLFKTAENEVSQETPYIVKAQYIIGLLEEFIEGQHWNNFGVHCKWKGEMNDNFQPEPKIEKIGWFKENKFPENLSYSSKKMIEWYKRKRKVPHKKVYE
ncbi:NUDIX hydrolase [Nanoarchaeota archaeon]